MSARAIALDELTARVRETMADRQERYAVEVADLLGFDPRRGYSRVKTALNRLEAEGALQSRLVPAAEGSGSGLPRRYYRGVG